MAWRRVMDADQLPEGGLAAVALGPVRLVVCRQEGRVYAYEDRCPHAGGPLSGGNFAGGRLICPWHAWEFDCATGAWDANPAVALRRFPARIEAGGIWVDA